MFEHNPILADGLAKKKDKIVALRRAFTGIEKFLTHDDFAPDKKKDMVEYITEAYQDHYKELTGTEPSRMDSSYLVSFYLGDMKARVNTKMDAYVFD